MGPTTVDSYQWQEIACSLKRPDWVRRALKPPVQGKREGLSRESNRSEAWSGILAFTSVEVESSRSFPPGLYCFTAWCLTQHGYGCLYVMPCLVTYFFFYIQILSCQLSAVFLWGTEFHIDMKSYAELQL